MEMFELPMFRHDITMVGLWFVIGYLLDITNDTNVLFQRMLKQINTLVELSYVVFLICPYLNMPLVYMEFFSLFL